MPSLSEIRLLRQATTKKYRDSLGIFVVEGEKMLAEARESGLEVLLEVRSSDRKGEETIRSLTFQSTPPPVMAVVRKGEPLPLPAVPSRGTFLALDSIRDPGNLGTMIRMADWFGLEGIYASPDTVEEYNPKVVQSTMGSVFRVPYACADLPGLCSSVKEGGGRVFGTFLDGRDLYGTDLGRPDGPARIIVIGNESRGISPEVAACVTDRILIPPYPPHRTRHAESLNAATATSVVLSEFRRRDMAALRDLPSHPG